MRRTFYLLILAMAIAAIGATPVIAAAPGDEPSTAIPVTAGTSGHDSSALTTSAADPAACDPFPGPVFATMWFRYAPAKDALTMVDVNSFVSTDGSTDFLAVVFVYRDDGGTRTLIGCSAYPATVFLPAESGATYLILVAGLSTAATGEPPLSDRGGTFDLTITPIRGRVQRNHFRNVDSFVVDDACAVPITVSIDDKITEKTFFDSTGPRGFTAHLVGSTTFTTAAGAKVTLSYAQTFTDYFDGTGSITGLPQVVIVNGHRIVADHGRLVFNLETGEVIFEAGGHSQFNNPVDICGLLGA